MSRAMDQFIDDDDEEETCPLCVEEFDLTDKGFRPCPCGYQICQFCYNNVKNNMNGLCPACRRKYNEDDIEYKVITPEEATAHKARQAQKQKKNQAAQQKEKQKADAETLSRKHLAGLRVMQKNLVYVTGLTPHLQEDKLLQILRSDSYFGQYGEIIKIVVSKARDTSHPQSVGVYVTYKRKEDAARCIAAVDGSKNGDRTLRAQFGTTKYCSAYLRGENCSNRNCMFLHEPGDSSESYSRAALSSFNAGQHGPERNAPPQSQLPVASASQTGPQQSSDDRTQSPAIDRPALPSTASWASKVPQHLPSRTESRSTSGTVESPVPVNAVPAPSQPDQSSAEERPQPTQDAAPSGIPAPAASEPQRPRGTRDPSPLTMLLKNFNLEDLKFTFSMASMPQVDADIIASYPPLFDKNGGAKRRLRRQREEEMRRVEQETQSLQLQTSNEQEETAEVGGSLQLGGEPEERQNRSLPQSAIQPPGQDGFPGLDQRFQLGISSPGMNDRGMTPQQQQHMILQNRLNQGSYLNNPNQSSSFGQPQSHPPGHQRNASRYSFANESSASTSVKPVANPKLLSQQSSIMPPTASNHFGVQHQQPHGSQFFTSNVQGPPPGLKTTGTPPVSGGMTFGQGHGFATGGIQYSAGANRNSNEEMMRNLLVQRRDAPGAGADQAKRDAEFPPLGPPSRQQSLDLRHSNDARQSTPPVPPGFEMHSRQASLTGSLSESRRSTPTVPPGLTKPPTAVPQDLDGVSRPSSRASLKRTISSQVQPVVPLKPITPSRTGTPTPAKQARKADEVETPTKAPKGSEKALHPAVEARVLENIVPSDPQTLKEMETQATKFADSRKAYAPVAQNTSKASMNVPTNINEAEPVTPSKPEPSKSDTQRRKAAPGKLDIAAATKKEIPEVASSTSANPESQVKDLSDVAQTPSVASPSVSSPAPKPAPKTIRVVQTPKTEMPPSAPVSTPKDLPQIATTKLPSRQPSVASIKLPGTPSSEQVSLSDDISVTSTSQSRANSPPPSATLKAGFGLVKPKTKNQLKKERQERARAIEAERIEREKAKAEDVAKTIEEEAAQAQEAIISRKKKSKKDKEPKGKEKSTVQAKSSKEPVEDASKSTHEGPAAFQWPDLEVVAEPIELEKNSKKLKTVERSTEVAVPEESQPSTPEIGSSAKSAAQPAKSPRAKPPRSPPAQPAPSGPLPHEPSPPPTPTLSAAQLLAEIKATAPAEIQKCLDSLFRTPTSNHYKAGQPILPKDLQNPAMWEHNVELNLTKAEVEALLHGTSPSLHYGGHGGRIWDRGMVTSTGAHLRALTKELEQRFLELEKMLREMPETSKFHPSKPQNEMKFPHIDLEALKRQFENATCGRGLSVMEQMVQDGSMTKKGAFLVDEANRYINEFVMPPATPPPSAGGGTAGTGAGYGGVGGGYATPGAKPIPPLGAQTAAAELAPPGLDIAERQLNEAKRVADERDVALKKAIKKNKKILGLG